jgi:hypothetical protein
MAYFQTKNLDLGKFWRQWKMFVYYKSIWSILRLFGIVWDHLVYFIVIWYNFPRFGMLYLQRKIWQPWTRVSNSRFKRKKCLVHISLHKRSRRIIKHFY